MPAPDLVLLAHGSERLPALTVSSALTTWTLAPVLLGGVVLAGGLYLAGVSRLRRRGVAWSTGRVVSWFVGLAIVALTSSSAIGSYDGTLFTVHSLQHLLLQMLAPVPLALAAPVTLALRALPRGGRRRLLAVLHSRFASVVTHPLVAFAIFIVSPFVLYYSPLYEATLRYDWLHDLNHVHFLAVGLLFFGVLLGLDPFPRQVPYTFRFMLILLLGPMHVLLGVPVMMGDDVFALDYYRELGRTWGPSLVEDQQFGGGLLWVFGDVVTVAFLAGVFAQWLRSDSREAKRVDRNLDRLYGDGPTMPAPWTVSSQQRT